MDKNSKIYIAGHRGLVGSALLKKLKDENFNNIITKTHKELDLTNQLDVKGFFSLEKPEYVFFAAAKVGGILANNIYRADFIYENSQMQNNIIHNCYLNKVKKLLFLGSSCIYPKNCPQPIREDYLLTSDLEYTNEPYAIAKIAGIKMCESYNLQYGTNFISVMPTNLYGYNDNYDLEKSHVLPALIRKIHLAKLFSENRYSEINNNLKVDSFKESQLILDKFGIEKNRVMIWGTGLPKREFLHSADLADACFYIMQNIDFKELINTEEIKNTHINIGMGKDISIKELALLIKKIIGFEGELFFDTSKPDGTKQKLLDINKLKNLGWVANIGLEEGIRSVYNNYISN